MHMAICVVWLEGHSRLRPCSLVNAFSLTKACHITNVLLSTSQEFPHPQPMQAVEKVLDGDVQRAFAVVRPPGHHAESSAFMGFCFYNNAAVAAHAALAKGRVPRRHLHLRCTHICDLCQTLGGVSLALWGLSQPGNEPEGVSLLESCKVVDFLLEAGM
jgi:hypothetical protein